MATERITVLLPTSPIASHPDTRIIEETISTIRVHLDSEIIIMVDGVREEQEDLKKNYTEYTRRLLWKANNEWQNVTPIVFEQHMHQALMTKKTLQAVRTPQVLFVEHDTPITPDRDIAWDKLSAYIESGKANLIRLHHEALVLDVHRHLMIGEPEDDLWATCQWSQRPALYNADYLRKILDNYFSENNRTFIEDRMYSVLEEAYKHQLKAGWNEHKVFIYYPPGDIKRSYHLDGRDGGEKFDDKLVF